MSSSIEVRGQSGVPVLLLPGGSEPLDGFFPGLVEGLIASGARVILHDRPGTGTSTERGTLSDAPSHLARVLAELNLGPVVVVGQSLGGAVALLFAARYPELVAGLVLLDPTPIHDVKACTQLEKAMRFTRQVIKVRFIHRLVQWQLVKGMRASMKGKTLRPEAIVALDRIGHTDIVKLANAVDGITHLAQAFRASSVPVVPTLFVSADRKPTHAIRRSHAALADALGVSLTIWPGSAHNVQLDHPDETLEAVRSLVARVKA